MIKTSVSIRVFGGVRLNLHTIIGAGVSSGLNPRLWRRSAEPYPLSTPSSTRTFSIRFQSQPSGLMDIDNMCFTNNNMFSIYHSQSMCYVVSRGSTRRIPGFAVAELRLDSPELLDFRIAETGIAFAMQGDGIATAVGGTGIAAQLPDRLVAREIHSRQRCGQVPLEQFGKPIKIIGARILSQIVGNAVLQVHDAEGALPPSNAIQPETAVTVALPATDRMPPGAADAAEAEAPYERAQLDRVEVVHADAAVIGRTLTVMLAAA